MMASYKVFNFKPSIDKPDVKFKVPSICDKAPVLETQNVVS